MLKHAIAYFHSTSWAKDLWVDDILIIMCIIGVCVQYCVHCMCACDDVRAANANTKYYHDLNMCYHNLNML